jgi:hypothetical protein
MDTQIDKAIDRIRQVISKPSVAERLSRRRRSWLRLTSSLDTIGDTECAIDSYERHFGKLMQFGSGYLQVYGVLQALVVQQDAVRHVAESLDVLAEPSAILMKIREIRNMAVGHPTDRYGGASHYITRASMRWEGFTLLTAGHESSELDAAIYVDLQSLIPAQRDCIIAQLVRCAMGIEDKYAETSIE